MGHQHFCEIYAVHNVYVHGTSLLATVWPGEFIELQLPDNNSLRDTIFAVETCSSNQAANTSSQWPQPSLLHTL